MIVVVLVLKNCVVDLWVCLVVVMLLVVRVVKISVE